MSRFKGVSVTLFGETVTGRDPFGKKITETSEIIVNNVLVYPATSDDVKNQLAIDGKKIVYTLAIPKGDKNDWADKKVSFFGETWRTVGVPLEGIESMIPLDWNKQIKVERYE